METFDYDIYEYYGELEYGSDSYWDTNMRRLEAPKQAEEAGPKRKRNAVSEASQRPSRKRKLPTLGEVQLENVLYMPFEARLPPSPPRSERKQSFALLPDWKQRFVDTEDGQVPKTNMPTDMQNAAEGSGEETATAQKSPSASRTQPEVMEDAEEDWKDDEEEPGAGGLEIGRAHV